jgi:hypothetical protein
VSGWIVAYRTGPSGPYFYRVPSGTRGHNNPLAAIHYDRETATRIAEELTALYAPSGGRAKIMTAPKVPAHMLARTRENPLKETPMATRKPRRRLPPRLANGQFRPASPAKRRARERLRMMIGKLLSAGRTQEAMRLMRSGALPSYSEEMASAPKRRPAKRRARKTQDPIIGALLSEGRYAEADKVMRQRVAARELASLVPEASGRRTAKRRTAKRRTAKRRTRR